MLRSADSAIQPLLKGKKVREIADAMQVSHPYAAFVRSGRRCPHPRHWHTLAKLVSTNCEQNDSEISRIQANEDLDA